MKASTLTLALLMAASVAAPATQAFAQSRPYAPALTCRALAGIVASRGAVVVSTSRTTYDRYVANGSFCFPTQVTRPAWVRAADTPSCFIGYTCKEFEIDDWW
ncbi:hypothetical protein IMF23_05015 [Chelatococcus daeguensis]|uniref:Secreted protein n=2 Tax=Chelatococcus TaxID=28209 RepID=A0AAC9JP06_9HYPH|nr:MULTISPECIES: hypothetical protein [Chelatococcus]APF36496.1 hypothetical protein BOQ54_03485 [Chelatococcus daeguensis]KZE33724.1 hypothetical protein AVW15_17910 [Chelatococcus daeguensis]MBM3082797.1 hypothetical protein [Chelatococcus daeguensis]CUA89588.1 hypothetical protein Ga0061061_10936 [Chelatococcus sambhunathii]